jgi:hypothetical protein
MIALRKGLRPWWVVFGLLLLTGMVSFFYGIAGPDRQRTWQVYLINFLFWSGIAFSATVFVAILNITNARWGRPLKRLAEALGAFTPVAFLLFWVLYFGSESIFPWVRDPVQGRESWLNTVSLFTRNGIGLFLLTGVSVALIYCSVRGDLNQISRQTGSGREGPPEDPSNDPFWHAQVILSPISAILFCFVFSLVAFDLVMSLDPHWTSTLFGGYYFIGSFYSGLAALTLLSGLSYRPGGIATELKKILRPRHLHDLGKLLFGFCLMTGYLFYTQFLVIWYGNIPEETHYLIQRLYRMPWKTLSVIILLMAFGVPFILLLIRRIKMKPEALIPLSVLILAGMWLERFLLVVPSLSKGQGVPLGLTEVLITGGFLGAMGLTAGLFLKTFSFFPLSDPLFQEEWKRIQGEMNHGS